MGKTWTTEQQMVIRARGENILVSAAAGSGKTAVLVERILSLLTDTDHPVDIDRLLIVTFTRAAAGELKERIRHAIADACVGRPGDAHLRRQMSLIHHAQITTIDGFCSWVVKGYAHTIGLAPGFRVAEEGELKLLKTDVAAEVLDAAYGAENPEEREAVTDFTETFAYGSTDRDLERLILRVNEMAESAPDPDAWLRAQKTACEKGGWDWLPGYLEDARTEAAHGAAYARANLAIVADPAGPSAYAKAAEADATLFDALLQADSYETFRSILKDSSRTALGRKKGEGEDPALRKTFQENRAELDAVRKTLENDYFALPYEEAARIQIRSGKPAACLLSLAMEFRRQYLARKEEKGLLDFPDLEHFTLQILRKDGERTPAARELSQMFQAVMIDEYQDSNYLQEAILTSVSRIEDGEDNYFQVGDVKQSIYSFRQARPDLFLSKAASYRRAMPEQPEAETPAHIGSGSDSGRQTAAAQADSDRQPAAAYEDHAAAYERVEQGVRIDLSRNFRSRREVVDTVNGIFRQIMRREVGGVEYDRSAELVCGAAYPEAEGFETELIPVFASGEDAERSNVAAETSDEKKDLEARAVAQRVLELLREGQVWDAEQSRMRPVGCRDIVILLRTMDGWAEHFVSAFEDLRIPVYSTSRSGYFGAMEVTTVLNYLRILDNPLQDIPFAAVLKSPFASLTAGELTEVRLCPSARAFSGNEKREYIWLYEAARAARADAGTTPELRGKLERFFALYDALHADVAGTPIHTLIYRLLRESGYEDYASALPGGAQRAVNLRMLVERASAYEKTSYTGLFNFVRYIENLQKIDADFGEASAVSEAADVVRIMSIHKSKGLEYPIVFLSGMHKTFNRQDQNAQVLIHPDLGIACDYVDYERRVRAATPKKQAVRRRMQRDSLGEELRVLYVAMTRAKQKLIMTGIVKNREKLEDKTLLLPLSEKQLPVGYLMHCTSYLDLVLPAAERMIRRAEASGGVCPLVIRPLGAEELLGEELHREVQSGTFSEMLQQLPSDGVLDERVHAIIEDRFGFQYPYAGREEIPAKVSVTELEHTGRETDPDSPFSEETEYLIRGDTPGDIEKDNMDPGDLAEDAAPGDRDTADTPELIPSFMKEEKAERPAAGTARGTAYHRSMQYLPAASFSDLSGETLYAAVDRELARLCARGRLAEAEKRAVRIRDLTSFYESGLGQRYIGAAVRGALRRERSFMLSVRASDVRKNWPEDEEILMQGIIDACFVEDDAYVLIDYKTDRVRDAETLTERYRAQLGSYAEALRRITGLPVREKWIWSFALGRAIPLN